MTASSLTAADTYTHHHQDSSSPAASSLSTRHPASAKNNNTKHPSSALPAHQESSSSPKKTLFAILTSSPLSPATTAALLNIVLFVVSFSLATFSYHSISSLASQTHTSLSQKLLCILSSIVYHCLSASSFLLLFLLLIAIVVLFSILLILTADKDAVQKNRLGRVTLSSELKAKWKMQQQRASVKELVKTSQLSEGEHTVLNLLLKYFFGKLIYEKQTSLIEGLILHMGGQLELPQFLGDLEIRDLKFGNEIINVDHVNARQYDVDVDYAQYIDELAAEEAELRGDSSAPKQTLTSENGSGKGLEVDVDFSYYDPDFIALIATHLWMDVPVPQFAAFPVEVGVEKVAFDVKLRLRIDDMWDRLWVSFREKPLYHVVFQSAFGKRPIRNLPFLSALINKRLDALLEHFIFPKEIEVPMPSSFATIQRESLVSLLIDPDAGAPVEEFATPNSRISNLTDHTAYHTPPQQRGGSSLFRTPQYNSPAPGDYIDSPLGMNHQEKLQSTKHKESLHHRTISSQKRAQVKERHSSASEFVQASKPKHSKHD